jgi:hypothetical protein
MSFGFASVSYRATSTFPMSLTIWSNNMIAYRGENIHGSGQSGITCGKKCRILTCAANLSINIFSVVNPASLCYGFFYQGDDRMKAGRIIRGLLAADAQIKGSVLYVGLELVLTTPQPRCTFIESDSQFR